LIWRVGLGPKSGANWHKNGFVVRSQCIDIWMTRSTKTLRPSVRLDRPKTREPPALAFGCSYSVLKERRGHASNGRRCRDALGDDLETRSGPLNCIAGRYYRTCPRHSFGLTGFPSGVLPYHRLRGCQTAAGRGRETFGLPVTA
jgi:hypothetical protein